LRLEGALQLSAAAISARLQAGRDRITRMKRIEELPEGSLNAENEA
jgi:hypothetical protein